MSPVPVPELHRKFEYFYAPYNFMTNTAKFMTFDQIDTDSSLVWMPPAL